MRLFNHATLAAFWRTHQTAERHLRQWERVVAKARWQSFHEVKLDLPATDQVGDGWLVFDLRGNGLRIVAYADYVRQHLYLRFIDTHADYDNLTRTANWKDRL